MKKQLIAAMIGLTALAACSKKNNSNNTTPGTTLAENTWSVDGKVYKANTVYVGGFMTAGDTSVTAYPLGITFYFYQSQVPTSSRTYKIARVAASADEINFGVSDSTGEYLSSSDNAGKLVSVTVASDGKLSLTVPEVITTNPSGGIIKHVAAHLVEH